MRLGTIVADMATNLPNGWHKDDQFWGMGPATIGEVSVIAEKRPDRSVELKVSGLFHSDFAVTLDSIDASGKLTIAFIQTDVGADLFVNGGFHSHLFEVPLSVR